MQEALLAFDGTGELVDGSAWDGFSFAEAFQEKQGSQSPGW
jgi:hypothetical protein